MQTRNINNLKGIDISSEHGIVDFNAVKNNDVQVVYIKASEGRSYKDTYLEQNYKNAKAAGLKVGFYHFFRGKGVSEAKHFFNCIKDKESDCRLILNAEINNGMDKSEFTNACIKFLEKIKKLANQDVAVCTSGYFTNSYLDKKIAKYPLWITQDGVNTPMNTNVWNSWIGFQYSSTGKVPGVKGNCDLDEFTRDILLTDTVSTN